MNGDAGKSQILCRSLFLPLFQTSVSVIINECVNKSISDVPSQQPILILGGEQNVLAAQANDMLSDPIELYNTKHNITGKNFI